MTGIRQPYTAEVRLSTRLPNIYHCVTACGVDVSLSVLHWPVPIIVWGGGGSGGLQLTTRLPSALSLCDYMHAGCGLVCRLSSGSTRPPFDMPCPLPAVSKIPWWSLRSSATRMRTSCVSSTIPCRSVGLSALSPAVCSVCFVCRWLAGCLLCLSLDVCFFVCLCVSVCLSLFVCLLCCLAASLCLGGNLQGYTAVSQDGELLVCPCHTSWSATLAEKCCIPFHTHTQTHTHTLADKHAYTGACAHTTHTPHTHTHTHTLAQTHTHHTHTHWHKHTHTHTHTHLNGY